MIDEELIADLVELAEYMERFEDCSLDDILIALEANMEAYYG